MLSGWKVPKEISGVGVDLQLNESLKDGPFVSRNIIIR